MQHIRFLNILALGVAVGMFGLPASSAAADAPAPVAQSGSAAPSVAARPLLFYQVSDTISGSDTAETRYRAMQAHVHDKLVPALTAMFGTSLVDLKSAEYSPSDIEQLCRKNGAVGVLAYNTSWNIDPMATTVIGAVLNVESCGGTIWFSAGGSAKETTGRDVVEELLEKTLVQVLDDAKRITDPTPNAKSNFIRYGMYMNDAESDSFWTLAIEDGRTVVDSCDPIGTAYRAGLRVGDVVTAVNGTSTADADQAKVQLAILEDAMQNAPVRGCSRCTRRMVLRRPCSL